MQNILIPAGGKCIMKIINTYIYTHTHTHTHTHACRDKMLMMMIELIAWKVKIK